MLNDAELLRRYASENSEQAFADFVHRHIALVYSVALRIARGDQHLADEVAQTVFTEVARKASALSRHPSLTGWLFISTRYAAAHAVRSAARRRRREAMAELMSIPDPAAEVDWEQFRPVLDEAVAELSARDMEAVLLRFYGGRSYGEIGELLSLSADGARSRIDRALEKLRAKLQRRGVTCTAAVLATLLPAQAGALVPAGLTATVTTAAVSAGAAARLTALVTPLLMIKSIAVLSTVVAAVAIVGFVHEHHANDRLATEVTQLRYVSAASSEQSRRSVPSTSSGNTAGAEPSAIARPRFASGTPVTAPAGGTQPSAAGEGANLDFSKGPVLVGNFRNVGQLTPSAAFQTLVWAAVNGREDVLEGTITMSDEARTRGEALIATLPAATQAKYPTPEKIAALFFAEALLTKAQSAQLVRETQVDDSHATLTIRGIASQDDTLPLRRGESGWQVAVTDKQMQRMQQRLQQAAGAPGG